MGPGGIRGRDSKVPKVLGRSLVDGDVGATDIPFDLSVVNFVFYIQGECIGGDPSAGSPTDTLLRLNPSCGALVQT